MNIICLDTVDSTNEEAKRRLRSAISHNPQAETDLFETAIIARTQTAGKGRRGKSFHSPDVGNSLYISFILQPPAQSRSLQLITVAAAVAVCLSVGEILADSDDTTQCPKIKWVNDVLIDNKKICGILAESVVQSRADWLAPNFGERRDEDSAPYCGIVLGIGVNINMNEDDFPEELRGIAGSLRLQEDKIGLFTEILFKNIHGIYRDMESGRTGAVLDLYRKFESTTGREVRIIKQMGAEESPITNKNEATVYAKAIADDGGLVVVYEDGAEEVLRSGEISIRDIGRRFHQR